MKKIMIHFTTFFMALATTGVLSGFITHITYLKSAYYLTIFAFAYFAFYYAITWIESKLMGTDKPEDPTQNDQ